MIRQKCASLFEMMAHLTCEHGIVANGTLFVGADKLAACFGPVVNENAEKFVFLAFCALITFTHTIRVINLTF